NSVLPSLDSIRTSAPLTGCPFASLTMPSMDDVAPRALTTQRTSHANPISSDDLISIITSTTSYRKKRGKFSNNFHTQSADPIPKSGLTFGKCATTRNGDLAIAWQRQSVRWLRWFVVEEQSPSPVFKIAETVLLRYESQVTEKFPKNYMSY